MPDAQLALGAMVTVIVIAIQSLSTIIVIRVAHGFERAVSSRHRYSLLVTVVSVAGIMLTCAHLAETGVWALTYALCGATEPGDAYYLAFVNFTTLGYGDLRPVERWRLLGPMTSASGMLMFGWSTAVLYAVLSKALELLRLD